MTANKLPYMHRNARSRRIKLSDIREVYIEDITRFIPHGVDRDEYVKKVMP